MVRAPVRIHAWVPSLPGPVAAGWGLAFSAWAGWKFLDGITPRMCEPAPIASWSALFASAELLVGLGVTSPRWRLRASLAGFAMHFGLIFFAFVAHVRRLPWKGCGCFGGRDLPWLPRHAAIAAALAEPFIWMFLDAGRRAQASAASAVTPPAT